jgi:hypothetical protein
MGEQKQKGMETKRGKENKQERRKDMDVGKGGGGRGTEEYEEAKLSGKLNEGGRKWRRKVARNRDEHEGKMTAHVQKEQRIKNTHSTCKRLSTVGAAEKWERTGQGAGQG